MVREQHIRDAIAKTPPLTSDERDEQHMSAAYGQARGAEGRAVSRKAFADLAVSLGWTSDRFARWAWWREWRKEAP